MCENWTLWHRQGEREKERNDKMFLWTYPLLFDQIHGSYSKRKCILIALQHQASFRKKVFVIFSTTTVPKRTDRNVWRWKPIEFSLTFLLQPNRVFSSPGIHTIVMKTIHDVERAFLDEEIHIDDVVASSISFVSFINR